MSDKKNLRDPVVNARHRELALFNQGVLDELGVGEGRLPLGAIGRLVPLLQSPI